VILPIRDHVSAEQGRDKSEVIPKMLEGYVTDVEEIGVGMMQTE
jgi:hypothetical protein